MDRFQESFCSAAGWHAVWSDHFTGAELNESKWNVPVSSVKAHGQTSSADCRGQTCIPLGSCREASCTREDVSLADGALVMRTRRTAPGKFATGAVNTWGKASWRANRKEGAFRMCITAMLPGDATDAKRSAGLWPAHWLMPHTNACDPDQGEMDIVEMVDGSGEYAATYHWQTGYPATNCSYPAEHLSATTQRSMGTAWNATYHEYGVERSASHVAFVLDGTTALNVSADSANATAPRLWDVPWYLILNTAVGGGWPGSPTAETALPAYHRVSSVVVARRIDR